MFVKSSLTTVPLHRRWRGRLRNSSETAPESWRHWSNKSRKHRLPPLVSEKQTYSF